MGKGADKSEPKAEPVKKKVGGTEKPEESTSLIRRGLEATKRARNSLGGGSNLGG